MSLRKSQSMKNKIVAIFFITRGFVNPVVLKTVTGKWYTEQCLPNSVEEVSKLHPCLKFNTLLRSFSTMTMLLRMELRSGSIT